MSAGEASNSSAGGDVDHPRGQMPAHLGAEVGSLRGTRVINITPPRHCTLTLNNAAPPAEDAVAG